MANWVEEFDYYPDRKNGPWKILTAWDTQGGGQECVAFGVVRKDGAEVRGAERIGTEMIRSIGVSTVVKRHRLRRQARDKGPTEIQEETSDYRVPDDDALHYRNVAVIYHAAWKFGRGPTEAVAKRLGVSRGHASRWIAEARKRGYLEPSKTGTAAGEYGPNLPPRRLPMFIGGDEDYSDKQLSDAYEHHLASGLPHAEAVCATARSHPFASEHEIAQRLAQIPQDEKEAAKNTNTPPEDESIGENQQ